MGIHIEEATHKLHRLLEERDVEAILQFLSDLQPSDIAELLTSLTPDQRNRALLLIDQGLAARTIEHFSVDVQQEVLTSLPEPAARAIIERISSDELADLLTAIEPIDAEEILDLIPKVAADEIRDLMKYPDDSAGGLMNPDVIAVDEAFTVEETIAYLREVSPEAETAYYIHVTDSRGILIGIVSLRALVVADPQTKVRAICSESVVSVPADMDQEEVARLFNRYGFLALPVIDEGGKLLGTITIDDVIDVIHEEASEDIAFMGGHEPLDEPYLTSRISGLVRKRIGWLLVLFAAQSVTSNILAYFESALESAILLAIFIPLLIDTGGNSGSQASTLVVRAMAVGEVKYKDALKVVGRECIVGLIMGAVMSVVAFFWSQMFGGGWEVGIVVALTIFSIILVASTIGSLLPILAKRFGFDPAVASAPLVTTVADATGLLIYFSIAKRILGI